MIPFLEGVVESRLVDDIAGLRQGDVFRWLANENRASADPWENLGVVVTADCDIVQNKHNNVLSYVPLLSVADYARIFVLPPLLRKVLLPKLGEMKSVVHRFQATYQPEFGTPISDEALHMWLKEEGPVSIFTGLSVPDGRDRARTQTLMEDILRAWAAEESGCFEDLVAAIAKLRGGNDVISKIIQQVRERMVNLPGDAFFVGKIAGIDGAGYIAYLRLVREIGSLAVAVKTSSLGNEGVRAQRVARLTAPFVYRLTQQLADVFSSIGLPAAYEKQRSDLVNFLIKDPAECAGQEEMQQ